MIVRDEEHHLSACLESIQSVVDEIVVVDTGSLDGTVAVAEAHGARVVHDPWRDDFARARNTALEHCAGSWILYIDADERVRAGTGVDLRSELERSDLIAATVTLHPVEGHSGYDELRLFRSDPRIRFRGLIHETIWPAVLAVIDSDGGTIGETGVVLDHVGYHGSQAHKHERNLPLLLEALAQDPDHIYCWFHLGQTYRGMGRPGEAREAWTSGIEAIRRTESLRPADSLPYIELITSMLDGQENVDELITEARDVFPDDAVLAWLDARSLMAEGRFEEAMEILTALVAAEESNQLSRDFGYDPLRFTSLSHAMLGTCHQQLGRHSRAAEHFARALEFEPESIEYRAKRRLNEHLAAS